MDIPAAGADTQAEAAAEAVLTPAVVGVIRAEVILGADTLAEELAAPLAEVESDSPVADVAALAAWGAVGPGD